MFIYCWHETTYNALKVGIGIDPRQRMIDYCKAHNLTYNRASLRTLPIAESIRFALEKRCHKILIDCGLEIVRVPGDASPQELFKIIGDSMTYDDAVELAWSALLIVTRMLTREAENQAQLVVERRAATLAATEKAKAAKLQDEANLAAYWAASKEDAKFHSFEDAHHRLILWGARKARARLLELGTSYDEMLVRWNNGERAPNPLPFPTPTRRW